MNIDKRIKTLIEEFGISPYVLAKAIGVSGSTITRILKGSKPRASTIKYIADYFNVYEKWLMSGNGPKNREGQTGMDAVFNNLISGGATNKQGTNKFIDIGKSTYVMLVPFVTEKHQLNLHGNFVSADFYRSLPYHPVKVSDPSNGFYMSFEVVGCNMVIKSDPCIEEGYIVTGREIPRDLWKGRLIFKTYKLFIIIHKEGIIVSPIDYADHKSGIIKVRDMEISLEDCLMILNIVEITFKV